MTTKRHGLLLDSRTEAEIEAVAEEVRALGCKAPTVVAGGNQATSDLFPWVRRHNPVPKDRKM